MADPNGTRYMDFEFFQKSLTFNPTSQFTSAGSEEGHTAFKFDNTTGKITETGDLIFSMAITGGAPSDFEIRIWVSRAIYNSTFNPSDFDFDRSGAYFDGASNGSAYGYARIIPKGTAMLQACGIVNSSSTPAGPWGTLNSDGVYTTNYSTFQFAEFGFNLSSFGIDPLVVKPGASVCTPAFSSYIVKTRASASFTAALKDFGGPYVFGGPQNIGASITGSNILTCDNTSATLTATASQASSVAYYTWTAPDGTKQSGTGLTSITATQTGIYTLEIAPVEGCPVMGAATFNLIEDKVFPPVATNPQSASYCVGGSPQALSVTSPGIGYQVRWFNTETGGTVLSTGATYTPTVAGTYYAETRNTTNGCTSTRIPVTLTEVADPSVSINVSEGSICLNGSTILTASVANGTGTTSYQWQSSLDNVSFTNMVGETNAILNIANLNITTHYRVIVSQSGSGCGTITSFSTRITVNPSCNPCNCQRQLLHNTDFENGTANGWVTGIVGQSGTAEVYIYTGGPTGRYAALNYRDYNSTTGDYYIEQKWNNIIPGRTYIFSGTLARHAGTRAYIRAEFYNASNQLLSQTPDRYATTEYPTFIPFSFDLVAPPGASYIRIVGFANRTALKMDNVKLVTCFEPIISFANLNDANTCTGGSVTFNTVLSDPSVVVNYQWQSSSNGTTWANITGATSSSLTVSPTVTTFYRVNATPTSGSCSTTSSYPLKVTIYPDPSVSVAAVNESICTGSSTTLSATVTNGTGTTNYQWQSSSDNVTFNNIVGATNATFNSGNLTTNQFYKVVVNRSGNGCNSGTSSVSAITVTNPSVTINSIGSKICVGRSATLATTVIPSQNVVGYQWQVSNDNSNWTNISNATNSSFDIPTATISEKYYRVIVSMNGGCGTLTTNSEYIKVGNFPGCDCIVQSCSAYTKLVYKNPIVLSDVSGLVGDKWRFNNVAPGFDAIVEITRAENANSLNAIDNTAVNVDDWCPEINFNFLAGQDSYVDWKITVVAAGTETPANLPTSSRVSSYDVDGNSNYREMHGHINSNGFIVNDPTELSIVSESPFSLVLGSTNEYTSISTDPRVKATFYYPGHQNDQRGVSRFSSICCFI
jgi:Ig-like domain CHU_C associated